MSLSSFPPILIVATWAVAGGLVAPLMRAAIISLPGDAPLRHNNISLTASRPLIMCVLAAGFGWLAWRYDVSWTTLALSVYAAVFLAIIAIDVRHHLILNTVLVPAAVFAMLASFVVPNMGPPKAIAGAIAGFLMLLLPALAMPGGLGGGDVKLAGFLGLAVGFPGVLLALVAGIIIAGLATIGLLLTKRIGRKDFIPYGPFLVAGAMLVLLMR